MKVAPRFSLAKLRRLYDDPFLSVREIAAELGVSPRSVRTYRRDLGLPIRPSVLPRVQSRWERIEPMVTFGLSYSTIARLVGVSAEAVSRMCKRRGIYRGKGNWASRDLDDWIAVEMARDAKKTRARFTRFGTPLDRAGLSDQAGGVGRRGPRKRAGRSETAQEGNVGCRLA